MKYFDKFLNVVDKGIKGEAIWIPVPYTRLRNTLGLTKKTYTIVGGDPGTGKSSFVDTSYILGSYAWMLNNSDSPVKPHIILRSMERSKEYRIAKWVCKRMFQQYGILLDVNTIFGRHTEDNRITKDIREKIESCREYFDKMQEYVTIIDGSSNPTGVFKDFLDYALKNGTLYINDPDKGLKIAVYHPKDKKVKWKVIPKDRFPEDEVFPERYEKTYIPDDEEELVIPIVDHIGEYSNEKGNTDKQNLDVAGSYTLRLRDTYGWSPIDVVQFNRNLSDQRRRQGSSLRPEEQDFMGSSTMYQRADVALALFNPHKYNISQHLGYNVQSFINTYGYNRFRTLWILKNTYGNADVGTGMAFYGEIGHYTQIPRSNEMDNVKPIVDISTYDNVIDLIVR